MSTDRETPASHETLIEELARTQSEAEREAIRMCHERGASEVARMREVDGAPIGADPHRVESVDPLHHELDVGAKSFDVVEVGQREEDVVLFREARTVRVPSAMRRARRRARRSPVTRSWPKRREATLWPLPRGDLP